MYASFLKIRAPCIWSFLLCRLLWRLLTKSSSLEKKLTAAQPRKGMSDEEPSPLQVVQGLPIPAGISLYWKFVPRRLPTVFSQSLHCVPAESEYWTLPGWGYFSGTRWKNIAVLGHPDRSCLKRMRHRGGHSPFVPSGCWSAL